jgi:hypothetical protein
MTSKNRLGQQIEAVRLINEAQKFSLSDAPEIYLNGHLKVERRKKVLFFSC